MKFNICDKVVLTYDVDSAPEGTIGIICGHYDGGSYNYTIYLPNGERFGHTCEDYEFSKDFSNKYPEISRHEDKFYYVPESRIAHYNNENEKFKKCVHCGAMKKVRFMRKDSKGKHVCNSCLHIDGYFTKNNETLYNPSSTHKTYGFEFECVPIKKDGFDGHVEMMSSKYGLIPTEDGSLPIGGIEYKTPTINGLRGVRHMFNDVYGMVKFSSQKCGQHINIGDSKYIDTVAMKRIRYFKDYLFDNLTDYMTEHEDDVKRVCGRKFTRYADNNYRYVHGSWLNLDNNNRLEFRISKFKNPKQYFELVNMWTEMLDAIINGFIIPYEEDNIHKNSINAEKVCRHMIRIFKRYADGKASVQARSKKLVKNVA